MKNYVWIVEQRYVYPNTEPTEWEPAPQKWARETIEHYGKIFYLKEESAKERAAELGTHTSLIEYRVRKYVREG